MSEVIAKLRYDILKAVDCIQQFTAGASLEDYAGNVLLRSAVERQFEIIGEALRRIGREDLNVLEGIRDYRKIIGFRNILAHGYDSITDAVVWEIIQVSLPLLLEDVAKLPAE